jgi:hypothetical protein
MICRRGAFHQFDIIAATIPNLSVPSRVPHFLCRPGIVLSGERGLKLFELRESIGTQVEYHIHNHHLSFWGKAVKIRRLPSRRAQRRLYIMVQQCVNLAVIKLLAIQQL